MYMVSTEGADDLLTYYYFIYLHIDGLMQKNCNPIASALELCLSCTNPSI